MTAKIGFKIFGFGASGFSTGTVLLGVKHTNGGEYLYRSAFCQGTSTCEIATTTPFEIKKFEGDINSLAVVNNCTVKLSIPGSLASPFSGSPMEFSMELFSESNKQEAYFKCQSITNIKGWLAGGIEILTTFTQLYADQYNGSSLGNHIQTLDALMGRKPRSLSWI